MIDTDTSEKGLKTLIMRHMTGTDGLAVTSELSEVTCVYEIEDNDALADETTFVIPETED